MKRIGTILLLLFNAGPSPAQGYGQVSYKYSLQFSVNDTDEPLLFEGECYGAHDLEDKDSLNEPLFNDS
ncbi:MAG TPA: hypothetical protein VI112_09105, partial [Bacteroidia bacterium]